jgi:hypothetical protein
MRSVGRLFPMLNSRQGALLVHESGAFWRQPAFGNGGRSVTRITLRTMSSMHVKSRRIRPSLNTGIGGPPSIASVNTKSAMSERPQWPYAVKNLSPVVGIANRWLYECATTLLAYFDVTPKS